MDRVFEELREGFGLSDKHVLILNSLHEKDLDARQICHLTKIPKGRFYNYINDLISFRLLEKSEKKPYKYSMKNADDKIMDFLKYRFDNLVDREKRVVEMMEKKAQKENIELVHSGDEFTYKLLQLMDETMKMENIVRHGSIPFPLYPAVYKDFQKVRDVILKNRPTLAHTSKPMTALIYKAYVDFYKEGKEFVAIVEKSALEYHFDIIKKNLGKAFLKSMIADIKERMKKYKIKIYVVDEYVPMQIFVTDKKVFMSIIHFGVTTGTVIQSDRLVNLYSEFFEDTVRRGKPIENYLKKM
jgi:predicted transcriptional regulator